MAPHVFYLGTDTFSLHTLQTLRSLRPALQITLGTLPDRRSGRGMKSRMSPVKAYGIQHLLPLHEIDLQTPLEQNKYSHLFAVSFGKLIPPHFMNACQYGGWNAHPSLLPLLRGSAPIQHALCREHAETGVTIQRLHPTKFDRGEIAFQEKTAIDNADTFQTLSLRLAETSGELLHRLLDSIPPLQAQIGKATHAPKIEKSMALFDPQIPAREWWNRYRGIAHQFPIHTPLFKLNGIVGYSQSDAIAPGHWVYNQQTQHIHLGTTAGAIHISHLTPNSEKMITAGIWSRRYGSTGDMDVLEES